MRNVIRLVSKWTGKAAGRTLKTGKQRNLINSDISEYARCYWLATVLLPPQVLSAWLLDVSDYTNTTIPLSPQCFLPYYWMSVITPIPPFPSPLSAFCLTTGCQWLHQYHHSPLPSVFSALLLDVSDYTNTTIPLSPQCFLPDYWTSVITPIPGMMKGWPVISGS